MHFVSLTYNQEDCIAEHLESIKHVVDKYSEGEPCYLSVYDDFSGDGTVGVVKRWIEANGASFKGIEIVETSSNLGINRNYLRALESLKDKRYFVLGGDDLYNDANIFDIVGMNGVTLSPVLRFRANAVLPTELTFYSILSKCEKHHMSSDEIRKFLRFGNFIFAPGAVIGQDLIDDPGLIKHLGKYKNIEDLPTWDYIFNIQNLNPEMHIASIPYVLYRAGSGISSSQHSEQKARFLSESETLRRCVYVHLYNNSLPGLFRKGAFSAKMAYFKNVAPLVDKDIAKYLANLERWYEKSQLHLEKMIQRARNNRMDRSISPAR